MHDWQQKLGVRAQGVKTPWSVGVRGKIQEPRFTLSEVEGIKSTGLLNKTHWKCGKLLMLIK